MPHEGSQNLTYYFPSPERRQRASDELARLAAQLGLWSVHKDTTERGSGAALIEAAVNGELVVAHTPAPSAMPAVKRVLADAIERAEDPLERRALVELRRGLDRATNRRADALALGDDQ